jgi:hypothetical protein
VTDHRSQGKATEGHRAPWRLEIGDGVDVHVKFNDSWSTGFEVADVVSGGYRVRRVSDHSLLPGVTGEDDLRHSRPSTRNGASPT